MKIVLLFPDSFSALWAETEVQGGAGAEDGVLARTSGRFREDELWQGLACAAVER